MKNKFLLSFLTLVIAANVVFIGYQVAEARLAVTVNGLDMVVIAVEAEDNLMTRVQLPAIAAKESVVLVSLADVTQFPHFKNVGDIQVSQIRLNFDVQGGGNASSTVKVGTIASTTPAGDLADIHWFDEVTFDSRIALNKEVVLDYSPSLMKLGINSASTTNFLSGDRDLASNLFATTTALTSPRGTATSFPNVGDLIMRVYDMKGTATITATTLYNVK